MVLGCKRMHKLGQIFFEIFTDFHIIIEVESLTCTHTHKYQKWRRLKSFIQNKLFQKGNEK